MSRNRGGRGRRRPKTSNQSVAQPPRSQQPQQQAAPEMDDGQGWSTKGTRQKKKNIRKPAPKGGSRQRIATPPSNNSSATPGGAAPKRKRNRRRAKRDPIEVVIDQIAQRHPQFAPDRDLLRTVALELSLRTFNEDMSSDVLDCILKHKQAKLADELDEEEYEDEEETGSEETGSTEADDDEEDGEEEDEDDEDDEEGDESSGASRSQTEQSDEDEEEEYEEEYDERRNVDQMSDEYDDNKDQSPALNEQRVSDEEEEEEEEEEPEEEPVVVQQPQRKKKKRKRKRKKKAQSQVQTQPPPQAQRMDDEDESAEEEETAEPEAAEPSAEPEPEPVPAKSKKKKRARKERKKKKKKETLKDKLQALDLRNSASAVTQIEGWMKRITTNDAFLTSFLAADGMSEIVKKIVLQFGEINLQERGAQNLQMTLQFLFDRTLCGERPYHQWLLDQLLSLSTELRQNLVKNKEDPQVSDAELVKNNELVAIICEEAANLVHAQTKSQLANRGEIVVNRDKFERPSDLLNGRHHDDDPVRSVLSDLNSECRKLSDMYHDLRRYDTMIRASCPTHSEAFRAEYDSIKGKLEENIQLKRHKQQILEQDLSQMQQEQNDIDRQQRRALQPLTEQLTHIQHEEQELLLRRKELEERLDSVKRDLQMKEMHIEQIQETIDKTRDKYAPEAERLKLDIYDRQFEMASHSQEQSMLSSLLTCVDESYSQLDRWGRRRLQSNDTQRSDLENNYVRCLFAYVKALCGAQKMVVDRVGQLREDIASLKRTNERTNKHYRKNFNIAGHLAEHNHLLEVDEDTRRNIENDIYRNMDKAQRMISAQHFAELVRSVAQLGGAVSLDLTKYATAMQVQTPVMPRSGGVGVGGVGGMGRQPLPSVSTQTQGMGGHLMNSRRGTNVRGRAPRQPMTTTARGMGQQLTGQQRASVLTNGAMAANSMNGSMNGSPRQPTQMQSHYAQRKPPMISKQAQAQQGVQQGQQQVVQGQVSQAQSQVQENGGQIGQAQPQVQGQGVAVHQQSARRRMAGQTVQRGGGVAVQSAQGPMKAPRRHYPVQQQVVGTAPVQQVVQGQGMQQGQGQQQVAAAQATARRRPVSSGQGTYNQQYN